MKTANPNNYEHHFGCFQCKESKPHLLLDGYQVGERMLGGVKFIVTNNEETGEYDVEVKESSKSYFRTLNQEMWLGKAKETANEDGTWFQCPDCGKDALPIWFMEEGWDK